MGIPDDVLEDESIVDYFVRIYVLPRINEAFEEMPWMGNSM